MRYAGAVLVSLMLATTATAQAQDVSIGLVAPLTGPAASYGKDILNGTSLAIEEINAAGGIGGRKIVLLQGDDRGSPKDAANVAQTFVSDTKVLAMIGGATSTATFGAVPVAQKGKLPFMITLASHPDLTKEGDYIFRNSTTQEAEGPALAQLVTSCLGAKSVGIIHLNNDWALAMTKEFKKGLEPKGVKVLIEESYDIGDNIDYASKLTKVKATNPDVIWFGSQYNDLALVLKQAQRIDLGKVPLVASAGDHSTGLTDVAGTAANGLYLHTLFFTDSNDPKVQSFVKKFQDKYKQAPNLFSAQAYDGMYILAREIKDGGFTRDGLQKALLSMKPYQGVGGAITFDPKTREAQGKTFTPLVVKDKAFTLWADCAKKLAK
jgi:branched-chain amino acid transport system substrate-binding protein